MKWVGVLFIWDRGRAVVASSVAGFQLIVRLTINAVKFRFLLVSHERARGNFKMALQAEVLEKSRGIEDNIYLAAVE